MEVMLMRQWGRGSESNRQPLDYVSSALPVELPRPLAGKVSRAETGERQDHCGRCGRATAEVPQSVLTFTASAAASHAARIQAAQEARAHRKRASVPTTIFRSWH